MPRDDDFIEEEETEEEFDSFKDYEDEIDIGGVDIDFDEFSDEEDEDAQEEEEETTEEGESRGSSVVKDEYVERLEKLVDRLSQGKETSTTPTSPKTPAKSSEEIVGGLLKEYEQAYVRMKEKDPESILDPEQTQAYAHQIGSHITKKILEYVDNVYGNVLRGIINAEDRKRALAWNSSLKRAKNQFFKDHEEIAGDTVLINKIDARITKDPRWSELQQTPDEEALYELFEEKYAPEALKLAKKSMLSGTQKSTKEKARKKKAASTIRKVHSSDSGNSSDSNKKRMPMKEYIARSLQAASKSRG